MKQRMDGWNEEQKYEPYVGIDEWMDELYDIETYETIPSEV